ncbi:MAG: hypothetical protein QM751_04490, partial [Paludibacteraceae bacterium]
FGENVHVIFDDSEQELVDFLLANNLKNIKIEKTKATVEDCFIDLSQLGTTKSFLLKTYKTIRNRLS